MFACEHVCQVMSSDILLTIPPPLPPPLTSGFFLAFIVGAFNAAHQAALPHISDAVHEINEHIKHLGDMFWDFVFSFASASAHNYFS